MRESAKHLHRSRSRHRTLAIRPEINAAGAINITPLIDVVLVLLIIFMVVSPTAERALAVALPVEQRTVQTSEVAATQLVVHVDDAGAFAINQRAVAPRGYVDALRSALAGRTATESVVFVTASDGAGYARLVEAMDGAKRAGAATVGLALEGGNPR